jgi:hypothetical protein
MGITREFFGKELQCHEPAKSHVLCFVDHTHSTAELSEDAAVREGLADERVGSESAMVLSSWVDGRNQVNEVKSALKSRWRK